MADEPLTGPAKPMFSNRFDWEAPANALGLLLARKKAAGATIYDLTQSNPTHAGLQSRPEQVLAALGHPATLAYDPDPRGSMQARQAITRFYAAQGAAIDAHDLFLTASTSEAYGILFKLLGNPGDEVLIPAPGYPLLPYLARFEGLRAIAYPLHYDDAAGWIIDLEVLQALVTARTRAIVLVNPNNPTGSYVKQAEMDILDAFCRRKGLALIVDEVFAVFAAPEAPSDRVAAAGREGGALTFILNGFSKLLALPQIKLGWIAVRGEREIAAAARQRLESLLDFYLSVSAPVQHAAEALLTLQPAVQRQIVQRIDDNARLLWAAAAATLNCRVLRREGGWYAVVEIKDALRDEARVLQLLDQDHTLVHPGFFYDFNREGFVVLSLIPAPEDFGAGVARLLQAFGRG